VNRAWQDGTWEAGVLSQVAAHTANGEGIDGGASARKLGKFRKNLLPKRAPCRAIGKGSNASRAGKDDNFVRSKVLEAPIAQNKEGSSEWGSKTPDSPFGVPAS
jgi:hypothetical protein